MNIDIFLSVRNKSTRLPGKAVLTIKGKTVTDHIIERMRLSKVRQVILCTSTNPNDDALVNIARVASIPFFRGSEEDKLQRYLHAARALKTDLIVIVDGDDIFCDPGFIDLCITKFEETNADYITVKNVPIGTAPFCIKTTALEKVCELKNENNTEIWTGCFTDYNMFKAVVLEPSDPKLRRPDIRLTLDYKEDFKLLEAIFEALYRPSKMIALHEVVDLLSSRPALLDINKNAQEWYLHNQQKIPKVTLKME